MPSSMFNPGQGMMCAICCSNVEPVFVVKCGAKGLTYEPNRSMVTAFGATYHAPCANLWNNRVDSMLPNLL